jgi:lysozyme
VKAPLKPHEFDALVSLHYNTSGIAKAALTCHLDVGNRVAAADAFLNGRRPASIIPRREAERDLFRHGRYPGCTIPVWSVDRTGRVDFSRPIRRLTEVRLWPWRAGRCRRRRSSILRPARRPAGSPGWPPSSPP